jgi:hypothetical protein
MKLAKATAAENSINVNCSAPALGALSARVPG